MSREQETSQPEPIPPCSTHDKSSTYWCGVHGQGATGKRAGGVFGGQIGKRAGALFGDDATPFFTTLLHLPFFPPPSSLPSSSPLQLHSHLIISTVLNREPSHRILPLTRSLGDCAEDLHGQMAGRVARERWACGWDRRSGRLRWLDQRDASMRRVGLSEDFRRFDSRFAYAKREQHFSKICLSHFVFEEIFISGDFFSETSINIPYTCERERSVRARNTSCS